MIAHEAVQSITSAPATNGAADTSYRYPRPALPINKNTSHALQQVTTPSITKYAAIFVNFSANDACTWARSSRGAGSTGGVGKAHAHSPTRFQPVLDEIITENPNHMGAPMR